MYDTGNGGTAAIVDVGHGTCNGTGGRYTAEERCHQIGNALCHQLGIGVVAVTYHTVGNGGTEQTFNGTEYGYGEGYGQQVLDGVEGKVGNHHVRQLGLYLETVADGVDALYAELTLHKQNGQCAQQYAVQGTWYLVQYRYAPYCHGGQDDNQQ